VSQIEEINVCFDVAASEELNAKFLRRNFVGQSEFTLILEVVRLTSGLTRACCSRLCQLLMCFLGEGLASVFLNHITLGGSNKFILLLLLGLLCNLTNAGVRIGNRLNFHIFLLNQLLPLITITDILQFIFLLPSLTHI